MKSCEDLGGLESGHIKEAAPDFHTGEAAGREARDDTEIVGTAFKGPPEVGIGRGGGGDDGAGGEDDFVAEDIGAN